MEKQTIIQKEKKDSPFKTETTITLTGKFQKIQETEKAVLFEYSDLKYQMEELLYGGFEGKELKRKYVVEREMYPEIKSKIFQAWVPKSVLENGLPSMEWIQDKWHRPWVTIKNESIKNL